MKIGFVGLGKMGGPMAARIARTYSGLKVFDLREEAMRRLAATGAVASSGLGEIGASVEVLCLCLPDADTVRDVVLGTGLADCLPGQSLVIDFTTSLPSVTLEIAEKLALRNISIIDAPVSGGTEGAEAGTLSAFVGGTNADLARATPVLECLAQSHRIFHVGAQGSGHAMKLVHSLINGVTMTAISEALVLGRTFGLAPETMLEVIGNNRGNSGIFQSRARRMLNADFEPAFTTRLMHKDLRLASIMADKLGVPTPTCDSAKLIYEYAASQGMGDQDMASIITVWERWSKTSSRR